MPGVVEMRDGLVGAIDRQRVLDQVIGADRDEVEVAQEASAASAPPPAPRSSRRARPARNARPASSSCWRARASASSVSLTSLRCATIGISMRTLPCAAARRIARSCWRNIAGSDRLQRIARRPSAGLSACSWRSSLDRHPVERLVGADVDRADRHRQAAHRLDRRRGRPRTARLRPAARRRGS